jgi:phage-related protein (TIGR01555 family)
LRRLKKTAPAKRRTRTVKRKRKKSQPKKPVQPKLKIVPKPDDAVVVPFPRLPKITEEVLARTRVKRRSVSQSSAVSIYQPAPGVLPSNTKLAMDDTITSALNWAGTAIGSVFAEGMAFLGYPELAGLATRAEYRRISEIIAVEMTRKWIKISSKGDDDKTDKIAKLEDAMTRLKVRDVFREAAEQDGWYGRSHLYIDLGTGDDPKELLTSIGNGRNEASRAKVGPKSLKALRVIEPVWTYPADYNTNDPLKGTWYKPERWFVMGKELHGSRLLTFIGREVPDILKPAYSFGGLSLSQMAKPYVDNWLRTRQSVSDIVNAFSVFVLKTDLNILLQTGGDQLLARMDLFNNCRTNSGLMAISKDTEDFGNTAAPLGTLDALQAQTQEHMAAVSGIPLVKLLGIQPAGLNVSSEGEIRTFYDSIHAFQEKFFREPLTRVFHFIQLSEFGEIDDEIVYTFEPLWALDEAQLAAKRKTDADTDAVLIDAGVISPETPYSSIDVDDMPEPPDQGMGGMGGEGGGNPFGGGGGGAKPPSISGGEKPPAPETPPSSEHKPKVAGGAKTRVSVTGDSMSLVVFDYDPEEPRKPEGEGGGQWVKGGNNPSKEGGAAGSETPDPEPVLHPEAIAVGGDPWNKATALRLETEYAKVKPKLEATVKDALSLDYAEALATVAEPADWDSLSSDDQSKTESQWKEDRFQEYLESEEQNWRENGDRENEAKNKVVDDFDRADFGDDDSEWLKDALTEWHDEYEDDDHHVPYTVEQIYDSLKLKLRSDSEGPLIVDFRNSMLDKPDTALAEGNVPLPGFTDPDPSLALNSDMRAGITAAIMEAFGERVSDVESEIEPPDYLSESAKEILDTLWNQMDDDEKYLAAQEANIASPDTYPNSDDDDDHPNVQRLTELPKHYDPLAMEGSSEADYRRTQSVARTVSVLRARDLIKERTKATPSIEDIAALDKEVWEAWKESSKSNGGLLLQVASADELGGRLRVEHLHRMPLKIRESADRNYKKFGGYEGIKAYIRAKWETTQYLLDKADIHTMDVYRAVNVEDQPGFKETKRISLDADLKPVAAPSKQEIDDAHLALIKWGNKNIKDNSNLSDFIRLLTEKSTGANNSLSFEYAIKNNAPPDPKNPNNVGGYIPADIAKEVDVFRRLAPLRGKYTELPEIQLERNGCASTTLTPDVANGWDGQRRVVLRAHVPRTAVLSVPCYGINVHSEREVVVGGLAWTAWDAWEGRAPTVMQLPIIKQTHADTPA